MIFHCVLYDSLRVAHPSLFPPGEEPTLGSFLADPTATHASFDGAIRRRGRPAVCFPRLFVCCLYLSLPAPMAPGAAWGTCMRVACWLECPSPHWRREDRLLLGALV